VNLRGLNVGMAAALLSITIALPFRLSYCHTEQRE